MLFISFRFSVNDCDVISYVHSIIEEFSRFSFGIECGCSCVILANVLESVWIVRPFATLNFMTFINS